MPAHTFQFITKKTICATLDISRSTLERYVADGHFPKPYKLGKHSVRWRSDEIESYLNELERMDDAYSSHYDRKGGQK